ncbi:MAG: response regulator [Thermomicrobiales bacterium]
MSESRSLGEAIRLRRLELGMSQEELAERIGPDVRQSDVSRLERGRILFPRHERLHQIASALGISVGALLVEAGWFSEEDSERIAVPEPRVSSPPIPILIADDEPISLDAIVSLLADYGYHASTAYDLPSLLDAVAASRPEIIIVDIALPGLNPEAFVEHVSDLNPRPEVVFMGTGFPRVDFDGAYLEKPIDSRQLLAMVGSIDRHDANEPTGNSGNGRVADR